MMNEYQIVPVQRVAFNVTVRNAGNLIAQCLESLLRQCNSNWICVVTDDASTDSTTAIVQEYDNKYPDQIVGIYNEKRRWKMSSFARAMTHFEPSDIVCELDGDDYIARETFVDEISRLHQKYDVVWTQHAIDTTLCPDWHTWRSTNLPDQWSRLNPARSKIWTASYYPGHLRTFKRIYFDQIDENHLKYKGEWLKVAADVAYFTPILEMVPSHLRYFYDRVCCVYTITEQNDTLYEWNARKTKTTDIDPSELQTEVGRYIQSLPLYRKISVSSCAYVVLEESVSQVSTFIEKVRTRLPFMRFHLLFPRLITLREFQQKHSTYGLHLYDLDRMINNSLSGIRDRLGEIRITKSTIAYFYPYCVKYILENHICDDLILVRQDMPLHSVDVTPLLQTSPRAFDDSAFCLHCFSDHESLTKMAQMHLENLKRYERDVAPLTLPEIGVSLVK